jgi:hypothetical protein
MIWLHGVQMTSPKTNIQIKTKTPVTTHQFYFTAHTNRLILMTNWYNFSARNHSCALNFHRPLLSPPLSLPPIQGQWDIKSSSVWASCPMAGGPCRLVRLLLIFLPAPPPPSIPGTTFSVQQNSPNTDRAAGIRVLQGQVADIRSVGTEDGDQGWHTANGSFNQPIDSWSSRMCHSSFTNSELGWYIWQLLGGI